MTKLISFLCAAAMVLGVSATAFAADDTTTAADETAVTSTAVEEATEEAATEEAAEEATEAATEEATEVATEATTEEATEAATEEATEAATEEATETATEEATEEAEVLVFVDVPDDAYYAEAVAYCAEKGLFNGVSDDEFAPDLTMTRGMFATVFGRLQDADLTNVTLTYSDVKADAYYAPYIAWATEQGIMDGYSDEEFGPDDAITREQAAKMLYAYATKVAGLVITEQAAVYTDSDSVSDWAAGGISANAALGYLIADANNNINPTAAITRADACYAVAATVKAVEAAAAVEEEVPEETAAADDTVAEEATETEATEAEASVEETTDTTDSDTVEETEEEVPAAE